MSISTPSKGTHFSDGVRVGPILGSQYAASTGVNPSTLVQTPVDSNAPGIYMTPMSLLDVIPAPVTTASLAALQTPAGAGYLILITASGQGATLITYQSIANVIQLDTPRNLVIQGAANVTAANYTVFGWDQYGIPLVEQITGPVGATQTVGKKAFLYVRAVYVSSGTVADVSVGVGNAFGLGHLVTSSNYIGIPEWNGNPDLDTSVSLANNPIASTDTSTTVTVTMPSTTGLTDGQLVLITGATAVGGITAPQLNIQAQITSIPNGTTFTYVAGGTATSTVAAGGGGAVIISYTSVSAGLEGTFVPGVQAVATATTGDVRGTYSPSSNANGSARLTINYYN